MAGEQGHSALADRLFETARPFGRGPYSNEEVTRAIRAEGGDISRAYLSYLRNGVRDFPTLQHLMALARFFGVPLAYFSAMSLPLRLMRSLRLWLLCGMQESIALP